MTTALYIHRKQKRKGKEGGRQTVDHFTTHIYCNQTKNVSPLWWRKFFVFFDWGDKTVLLDNQFWLIILEMNITFLTPLFQGDNFCIHRAANVTEHSHIWTGLQNPQRRILFLPGPYGRTNQDPRASTNNKKKSTQRLPFLSFAYSFRIIKPIPDSAAWKVWTCRWIRGKHS